MRNDAFVQEIDAKIRKLQELRKIAADPQMFSLLTELISVNGNATAPKISNTKSETTPKKKGNVIRAIEVACRQFGMQQFTIREVIKALDADGYEFKAKDKNVAVYTALKSLMKKGVVRLVVVGKGAKPSEYQMNPDAF